MTPWIPISVALGGAIGSLARFAAVRIAAKLLAHPFPVATLAVNILGSLAIGFWLGYLIRPSVESMPLASKSQLQVWDAAIRVGLLGGLTTFSSFSIETVHLLQQQQFGWAVVSILANVVTGVSAAWFGLKLAEFAF